MYGHELYVLSITCSCDHYGLAISSNDSQTSVVKWRLLGGLAILRRKNIASMCKIVDLKMMNVYLPYGAEENLYDYLYGMIKIDNFINDYHSPDVYVFGDYNADLLADSRFGRELSSFCEHMNLIISNKLLQSHPSYPDLK